VSVFDGSLGNLYRFTLRIELWATHVWIWHCFNSCHWSLFWLWYCSRCEAISCFYRFGSPCGYHYR